MTEDIEARVLFRVVLADANVLYPRVLRDYLLYAMTYGLIRVLWSTRILDELVTHLRANIAGFDQQAGQRLIAGMNGTFPNSQITATDDAAAAVAHIELPDEDDRHVLAAAVSAEVDILCTDNIKHFPPQVMAAVGIEVLSADALLSRLTQDYRTDMLNVHRTTVARLQHATDESTILALRRAHAPNTADLIQALLNRS